MHSKENFKSQRQCRNIYRWNKTMCEAWDLWEKGGHKDETQLAMRCLFLKLSNGDSLHYYIDFWCFRFSIKKKGGKKKTKNAQEIIFSLSFLGRLTLFHLTTAFNSYQSSTSTILPPFCQQSLRILTESQSLNWQWRRLPATALKQFVKKLTNHGRLAAFKKRTIVFKKCLLPCILKQYLRDCFTQGRRALNQVINSD